MTDKEAMTLALRALTIKHQTIAAWERAEDEAVKALRERLGEKEKQVQTKARAKGPGWVCDRGLR